MRHRLYISIALLLLVLCKTAAQQVITGTVTDGRQPLSRANVFIARTIDGALTDSLGQFRFTTQAQGKVTLRVSHIGYEPFTLITDVKQLRQQHIVMRQRATDIGEVVITASSFRFGKGDQLKTMSAHDIVMAGNSCGDIVAALQSLPGTQKVGEDGKLYVRGGDSDECQTFINGMHVLVPYTTNVQNSVVRGRFSPFLFKGINFSLGGYDGEYGQALSSVLPMETTDAATSDKLGVSASLVNWNVGGTKALDKGALSFNADYTSLSFYNRLFDSQYDWKHPYRKLSGEAQYKMEVSPTSVIKTYAGYDFTTLTQRISGRNLSLGEHNAYANAVWKTSLGSGYTLFAGMAGSLVTIQIDEALVPKDTYRNHRNEIHLKANLRHNCSSTLKWGIGLEEYLRNSSKHYQQSPATADSGYHISYQMTALHADGQWRIVRKLFANLSVRTEYTSNDHQWLLMPRGTLSYMPNHNFQLSIMAGRYSQAANDDYMARNPQHMRQATADHAILSLQYQHGTTLLRVEPYYKYYHHLPLLAGNRYTPDGHGWSKGLDIYCENASLVRSLTTALSYSYNDAQRLWLDFPVAACPVYASRHNLRLTMKYRISPANTYIGLTHSYTSGRPYTNPQRVGFMNSRTHPYNSTDMSITVLINERIIAYASVNNILRHNNVFGYHYQADGSRKANASDYRFIYLGVFVSLKNNKAYDISNF